MPLDRVKANELLELVVIDQSPKARELLLDKLEECVTDDGIAQRVQHYCDHVGVEGAAVAGILRILDGEPVE